MSYTCMVFHLDTENGGRLFVCMFVWIADDDHDVCNHNDDDEDDIKNDENELLVPLCCCWGWGELMCHDIANTYRYAYTCASSCRSSGETFCHNSRMDKQRDDFHYKYVIGKNQTKQWNIVGKLQFSICFLALPVYHHVCA